MFLLLWVLSLKCSLLPQLVSALQKVSRHECVSQTLSRNSLSSYFLPQLNCSSDHVLVSMKLQLNFVKLSEIEFYFVFIGHFRIFFFILSWSSLVNSWMTALPDSSDALQCAIHIVECFSQNCFPTQYTLHILHGLYPGPPSHTTFS